MRTSRAWCIELQRTVSIAEAQAAYFEQPEPRRRFGFLCADPACRERTGARMTAVHDDRLFFDDAFPTSAHFAAVPQSPHDPLCEDVLREQAANVVRNESAKARGDLNASRRFSTKQAFEVFDIYHPAVAGLLPLSALLADGAGADPQASARSVMPARLVAPAAVTGLVHAAAPNGNATAASNGDATAASNGDATAVPNGGVGRVPNGNGARGAGTYDDATPHASPRPLSLDEFDSDDDAIRALEQAIEAMARREGDFIEPAGFVAKQMVGDAAVGDEAGGDAAGGDAAGGDGIAGDAVAGDAVSREVGAADADTDADADADVDADADADADAAAVDETASRIVALADDMRTRSIATRRLADVVACYSELGAVDRQKALIRLPGGRPMSYASFIQPLSRYQDSDEPLVRVGGARVMREERGYVLRFFDRIVLDGERYEVVMRISDARIAASPLSGLLRAQLLAALGDGHHVRVFFFGGIAPDSKQHNLTQVRLSDLENLVLQPMRVAGAGVGASALGRNPWPGAGASRI